MASVTVVLRKTPNSDDKHNLYLRIIKDRKISQTSLGHSIPLSDWDDEKRIVKKSHRNSAWLNNLIASRVSEATDKLLEMEKNKTDSSARVIKNAVLASKDGIFFKQAQIYIDQLKATGKFNQRSADEPRINKFKKFLKNADINFSEISPGLLKKFKAYLIGTFKMTERTAVNHLVVIRTIYNRAVADGVTDKKNYPFGKGKVVIKFPDSAKIGLTADEVKVLEELDLPSGENHARNLWLVSFYFAGMRVSDVLRLEWSDFQNGRLYYAMGKNLKAGSLKVPDRVAEILKQYPQGSNAHDLVFPDLAKMPDLSKSYEVQSYIKTRVHSCNDYLKNIAKKLSLSKPLTMHIARHTFAQISADRIPANILQRLYRHSDIKTTMGYQSNFINKTTDDALDAVINL
ncbi:site-specific integrase [Dyadobacter pollutisoli]|jgi:integrase|uniref:Site-specific integrase n=1 Tax=Dyadobacter pollutisoli TaxID=2910158 RepID=A0A9E8SLJ6_9BACT|nr:site-specific integrase [Dyadobacter pollutisoli]WAC11866.1 site-specific integrase [Dyadobacter pollutisoli]